MSVELANQQIQIGESLKQKWRVRKDQMKESDYYFGFMSNDEYETKDQGKINRQLYLTEGRQAVIDFAAELHGNLTNPTQRWFGVELLSKDKGNPEYEMWADSTETRMYEVINETNFMAQIHEAYLQLGRFNNFCVYSEPDVRRKIRFTTRDMRNIYFSEASNGIIDRVYYYHSLTAKQMQDKWGDKIPEKVQASLNGNKPEDEYEILHVVQRREKRDSKKLDPKNMAWASYMIFIDEPFIIEEGGYKEMPYHIARFYKQDGEACGIGPSFYILPSARQADFYKVKEAQNIEKQLNPLIIASSDDYQLPDETSDINIIVADEVTGGQPMRKIDISGDPQIAISAIEREVANIRKAFFLDRFSALQGITKEMTATETAELINESTRFLGPVVNRINSTLQDMLERFFRILMDSGELPPVPEGLEDYSIKFESFLTRAQRANELSGMQQWLMMVQQIAQIDPAVVMKVDLMEVVDGAADIFGIKQKYIVPTEVVQEQQEAQAAAAQEAQQQQQLIEMAKVTGGGNGGSQA